jgi:Alkylmercury lyase
VTLSDADLALRTEIFRSFAETGGPPALGPEQAASLARLAEAHVVVLGDDGGVVMAHPFAAHRDGAQVEADGREWWGNCAWDALGIVALLGLGDAVVESNGVTVRLHDGSPERDAVFHVLVPARDWWVDVGFT